MGDPNNTSQANRRTKVERRRRIMVVDDELSLAELLAEMSSEIGYECDSFSDPQQALSAFSARSGDYDIVICDQTMPEMTGLELIQQMRTIKPSLGAVLCSGFTRRATERDGSIDPSIRFLNKPYTFEMLQAVLDEVAGTIRVIGR